MGKKTLGANITSRPTVGEPNEVFIDLSTDKEYVWEEGEWKSVPEQAQTPAQKAAINSGITADLVNEIKSIKSIGRYLALWNCSTGLPTTNPGSLPYTYQTGDYYRVGTVASAGSSNYKPNGATYSGSASTTAETATTLEVGMVYIYDGTTWTLTDFNTLIADSLLYTTVAPTAVNNKGLKIALLASEPETKYDGWLYLIKEA